MVSIIIPNFNHSSFLKERIESAINQTYSDYEVIILDDCSTDNSRDIINNYRFHPKVTNVVFNETNSGSTFKQWQKGIQLARGEWIWIAESDDYCDYNFLQVLLDEKISNFCGLRYCQSYPVDKFGSVLTKDIYILQPGSWQGINFLKQYLLELNRIPNASGVIVKRKLLKTALTQEISQTKLLGDWIIWCKLALITDIFYSINTTNYHRQHNQTVRSSFANKGNYFSEFSFFRKTLEKYINQLEIYQDKVELLNLNKTFEYREEGFLGCELIRNKKVLEALPHIFKASFFPTFSFYFLKSALYWLWKTYSNGK